MSYIKISDLTNVTTLTETDVVPIVNETETKNVTIKQIKDFIANNLTSLKIKTVDSIDNVTEENILYLVPNGEVFDEYLFVNGSPEYIGTQSVDLSNYSTTTEVQEMINNSIGIVLEGEY